MKNSFPALLLILALPALAPAQSFDNGQAASLVLGQVDLISDPEPLLPPNSRSLNSPSGITIDPVSGKIFVADRENDRVLRYASAATLATGAGAEMVFGQPNFSTNIENNPARSGSTFFSPTGVFLDAKGRLWVADGNNHRVLMFENAVNVFSYAPQADRVLGQADFFTGASGNGATQMNLPGAVFVDSFDRLWVADSNNNRVLRFDNATQLQNGAAASGVLGQPGFGASNPGLANNRLDTPVGIHMDSFGTLWIADAGNNRVVGFENAGFLGNNLPQATRLFGQPNFDTGTFFPPPTATTLGFPTGVLTDSAGNLWVSDNLNSRILRFPGVATLPNSSPATLVLGQTSFTEDTDNFDALPRSSFRPNNSLAIDALGRLWTSDITHDRVLAFTPISPAPPVPVAPPTLAATGKTKITTTKSKLTLKGTATNATLVEFQLGKAKFKKAKGSATNWKIPAKLASGKTIVKVRATGPGGTSKILKFKITRK